MKKYIILHLSLILLVFIACTDDQKQDDKNITFQRSDFKVRKSLSGKTIEFDSLILQIKRRVLDSFLIKQVRKRWISVLILKLSRSILLPN